MAQLAPAAAAEKAKGVMLLGSGVTVSVGAADVSVHDLPGVVAEHMTAAGYACVDARVHGDHLRVTARSQTQTLRAPLRHQPGPDLPFESAIDRASGHIRPGTRIVFASGAAVEVGRRPVPIEDLPAVVEAQLGHSGLTDVRAEYEEGAAGDGIVVTAREEVRTTQPPSPCHPPCALQPPCNLVRLSRPPHAALRPSAALESPDGARTLSHSRLGR